MRALPLLLLAPALVAQAPKLSFNDFQAWMKATAVPGYKLMQCEKDGNGIDSPPRPRVEHRVRRS